MVGPMSKVTIIAKLTIAEGTTDAFEAALAALVTAADEEDGLELYSAHVVDAEPSVYYFFEVYRDADAFAVHGKTDGMRSAMRALGPFLAGAPEIIHMTPVAAKGLDI